MKDSIVLITKVSVINSDTFLSKKATTDHKEVTINKIKYHTQFPPIKQN